MNTFTNKFDALESLIQREGIRIETLDFHPELDLFLVVLNTKAILRQQLSHYTRLKTGSITELKNFELTGDGTGVHWPALDEDLSLKGFLKDELKNIVLNPNEKAA